MTTYKADNLLFTSITTGLTAEEVKKMPKNIPAHHVSDGELALIVIKNQIFSFFFALLIISGVLSLLLHHQVDAIIFFAIAGINAAIGFFQEFRANKSTRALENLIAHTVTVRRNGILQKVLSSEVVLGDIVIAEAGDVVVADILVRTAQDLFIDESIRTGETLPRQGKEGETIFAGVNIIQGNVTGQVIAVGKQSSIMMYAEKIVKLAKNDSFEKFIHSVSRSLLILTVICLAVVFIANVLVTHNLAGSDYVLYAIAMLVGVVPESLPLIVTLILTREALVLAKHNVIVKKLSVLQNLGGMNYLFMDKTGTITQNTLKVQQVIDLGNLTQYLSLITQAAYERTPMDLVFDKALERYLPQSIGQSNHELQLSPFQVARGYSLYTLSDGTEIIRGQYEHVCGVCSGDTFDEFSNQCRVAEEDGLRIIAFALKNPQSISYNLLGAVAFEDPLKEDAPSLYQDLKNLFVRPKIVTGDSVPVASYIGKILDHSLGKNLVFSMDHYQSRHDNSIEQFMIYARCKPEQKSELIDEHLRHGIVGFLGEGINDALALKRADVGFVVNNASDVARQAGDVILLEKSLDPLIAAVRMSRKAFAHIRTYLLCTLAGNIGTLISLTAVVVFWQEIPMLPIQILLNNLLTDVPLMFLIMDQVPKSVIERPVRDQAQQFFKWIFIFAVISSLFDFILFFAFQGYGLESLRTGWFVFSVLAELTLVFSLRSELPLFRSPKISKALLGVLGGCFVIALALPYISFGKVFALVPLSLTQLGIMIGIILVYLGANELTKKLLFKSR